LSTNDSYLWLSSRNEPWEQVLIHWKNSFQLRQESEATTAFDFIEQWPILKQSNVDTLVSYSLNSCSLSLSLSLSLSPPLFPSLYFSFFSPFLYEICFILL